MREPSSLKLEMARSFSLLCPLRRITESLCCPARRSNPIAAGIVATLRTEGPEHVPGLADAMWGRGGGPSHETSNRKQIEHTGHSQAQLTRWLYRRFVAARTMGNCAVAS